MNNVYSSNTLSLFSLRGGHNFFLLNSYWRSPKFSTFWIFHLTYFLPSFVAIAQVEHRILVISQNYPENFQYMPYNSLKYKIAKQFRLLYVINFILAPRNNIKEKTYCEMLLRFQSRDVTFSNLVYFGFLANLGPKNDQLYHLFWTKNTEDMLKKIVLGSQKWKQNEKIFFKSFYFLF